MYSVAERKWKERISLYTEEDVKVDDPLLLPDKKKVNFVKDKKLTINPCCRGLVKEPRLARRLSSRQMINASSVDYERHPLLLKAKKNNWDAVFGSEAREDGDGVGFSDSGSSGGGDVYVCGCGVGVGV